MYYLLINFISLFLALTFVTHFVLNRLLEILSMISSNTGCLMSIAKNVMNVGINLTHFDVAIIVVFVDRYFVTGAVVKKYPEK